MRRAALLASTLAAVVIAARGDLGARVEWPHPSGYVAVRTSTPLVIDGWLDDAAWVAAPWTALFVDIEGDAKPKPALNTRAKMLWDDRYLYIGAQLDEPHLWSEITQHDAVIFRENDFEVFIDPDGDSHMYYEFEINARGTFWDVLLPVPYRAGGHAVDSWDFHGLQSAVHLDGTLNFPDDIDRGWTVELAMPWSSFGPDERHPAVPRDGDQWRINFSRVEWATEVVNGAYRPMPNVPEHNWTWSPQHVLDMHRPERWGYVQFSTKPSPFVPDASWTARQWLQTVFEAQREFRLAHKRYAGTLAELGIGTPADAWLGAPHLFVTPSLFEATIELSGAGRQPVVWHIRQDARVWRE